MFCIGRQKVKALSFSGKSLNWLYCHRGFVPFFKLYRFIWEMISPSKVYYIVSSSEYAKKHNATIEVLKSNRMGYAANAVAIAKDDKQILKEAPLPDLQLSCFSDVSVRHGSDFIIDNRRRLVINDYCATIDNSNKTYTDETTYLYIRRIVVTKKWKECKNLESGIMIGGKFSFNYYHNVYENLIRLLVVEDINDRIPKDVPLLVDKKIIEVPTYKRIYDLMSSSLGRKTVVINHNEMLNVQSLYIVSHINYLVPQHIDYTKGKIEDYTFDKEYTLKLRKILLDHSEKGNYPRRFFITRKNTAHRHFNEDELFKILRPLGFQKVAPEEYTFEQQVGLFNEAEWIIGGSGAAFTNLLFISSSCTVVCVYRNSAYIPPVFTPPVCFNGAKMYYFQSNKGESVMRAHTDFTIDVNDFRQFVDERIAPVITN